MKIAPWLHYSHDKLKKLTREDSKPNPAEKTDLEQKGKYDITHSIQAFNKGRTIARTFRILCKWLRRKICIYCKMPKIVKKE